MLQIEVLQVLVPTTKSLAVRLLLIDGEVAVFCGRFLMEALAVCRIDCQQLLLFLL